MIGFRAKRKKKDETSLTNDSNNYNYNNNNNNYNYSNNTNDEVGITTSKVMTMKETATKTKETATKTTKTPRRLLNIRQSSFSSLSSYKTQSISKHYALNNQILSAFDSLYDKGMFRGAYAFGVQFLEVALLEIPKHGYFYCKRHRKERMANAQNSLRVIDQLFSVLNQVEGSDKSDWDRLSKFKALAHEQQQNVTASSTTTTTSTSSSSSVAIAATAANDALVVERYERDRLELEQELATSSSSILCGDIMEYAELICPGTTTRKKMPSSQQPTTITRKPSLVTANTNVPFGSLHSDLSSSSVSLDTSGGRGTRHKLQASELSAEELQRALFLSGAASVTSVAAAAAAEEAMSSSTATTQQHHHHHHRRKRSESSIDITSLIHCYHEDFDELRKRGRIRISQASTYQGRLEGSINGCTVIAPLMCLHHLLEEAGHGLPDAAVGEVIDCETPTILPQVREKLGLTKDALIIPSDVHDFLIDRQLLASEQFVTVCGGNILDDAHVNEFIKNMMMNTTTTSSSSSSSSEKEEKEKEAERLDRKLAATFFFHEHVIAILQLQRSPTEVWFDLIDSLPHQETLLRPSASSSPSYQISDDFVPNASRIRCMTEEALRAALKWYACSRFTDDNRQYIDMYDWDEAYSDFDPRVFQAFVWADMK